VARFKVYDVLRYVFGLTFWVGSCLADRVFCGCLANKLVGSFVFS